MSLKGRAGALEYCIGGASALLFCGIAWTAFQGVAGASYTAHLRAVLVCLVLLSAQGCALLVGLVLIATAQHRELRRSGRAAAVIASRRAGDGNVRSVSDAASDLRQVAEALKVMMQDRADTAETLDTIVARLGVDVVRPVPPPGGI